MRLPGPASLHFGEAHKLGRQITRRDDDDRAVYNCRELAGDKATKVCMLIYCKPRSQ